MRSNDDRRIADIEFGVRSRDGLHGERITSKPTLAMAEDHAGYLRRISDTRGTYKIRVELVHRLPGGEWTPLSSEDAQQMKDEAWAGLDAAMTPVIAAGLEQISDQQRTDNRPYAEQPEAAVSNDTIRRLVLDHMDAPHGSEDRATAYRLIEQHAEQDPTVMDRAHAFMKAEVQRRDTTSAPYVSPEADRG